MSGSDNSILCGGVDKISPDNKTCTSCAQKVEHCKNDGKDVTNDDDSIKDLSSIDTDLSEENSDDTLRDNVAIMSENLGKLAVSDNNDDKLFQDPPPKEDCAICMLPLPYSNNIDGFKKTYQPCCGKILCDGCKVEALEKMRKGELKQCCPYCGRSTSVKFVFHSGCRRYCTSIASRSISIHVSSDALRFAVLSQGRFS